MNTDGFRFINLLSNAKEFVHNTLKISFGGYLLNRKELMSSYLSKFEPTITDAEIVLRMYEKLGVDCLDKIKGMFVFAIQNLENNSIIIVRDRVGNKPLYYSINSSTLIFASNLKDILRENAVKRVINKTALAQYLMLTYIPAPFTIVEDIFKLQAGHYLQVDSKGTVTLKQYWDVEYNREKQISDYNECKTLLRSTLISAVESCLEIDASAGVLLSGGIDSNIITGIMSAMSKKPVETFSVGCSESKDYDESDRANLSAKFHSSNHHLFFVDYKSILDNIDKSIQNIDEPFADSSYLPTYTISDIASRQVNTVFTGDAGDELFAGYNKYLIGHYSSIYEKLPSFIRNGLIKPAINILPSNLKFVRKANKVIDNSFLDIYTQRRNMMCLGISPTDINKLVLFESENSLDFIQTIYNKYVDSSCEVDQTLYTDFKVVLEGCMLTKADRTSRLANVTSVAPILHPDVVDLSAKIPFNFKIRGKDRKIILKDTFSDMIPNEIFNAKKTGFAIPLSYWLKNELKDDLLSTLNKKDIDEQGLLNYEYVRYLINSHISGQRNYCGILWAIYVFQKWYKNYFAQ